MSLRLTRDPINPAATIVPLFGTDPALESEIFLGTAFFVAPSGFLITAEHVLGTCSKFAIAVEQNGAYEWHAAVLLTKSTARDIAVFEVKGYSPPYLLPFGSDENFHTNTPVMCFEYSTTTIQRHEVSLAPASRVGNITRRRDLGERYGEAGISMLELSFPALRGASGAPVVNTHPPFNVIGVIKSNVSYHLLPVQIETVLDEKNEILEQTQYLLPLGLAVHVKHVIATIAELVVTT